MSMRSCAQELSQIFARSLSPKGANDEERSRYVVEVETTNKKFKRMWRPGSGQFKYTTRYGLAINVMLSYFIISHTNDPRLGICTILNHCDDGAKSSKLNW